MKAVRVVPLLLVLVLILAVWGVACGGGDDPKAQLSAALDKVDAAVAKFQSLGLNSTVPEIKAARDDVRPLWDQVVVAAEKVKGADVEAAKKAWADVDAAVNAVPDDANIMEAAAVLGPVQNLMKVVGDLKALVAPKK